MVKLFYIVVSLLLFSTQIDARPNSKPKFKKPYVVAEKISEVKVGDKILTKAQEYLGKPYGFGNRNDFKTDCSGFTQEIFEHFGLSLPRSAALQSKHGTKVDIKDLQVGDLLFYRTYKKEPSHVAIYAGNGQIIHASFRSKKVQFDSIDKKYYKQRFMYAKRLALIEQDSAIRQN